jgi:hypothetical protein
MSTGRPRQVRRCRNISGVPSPCTPDGPQSNNWNTWNPYSDDLSLWNAYSGESRDEDKDTDGGFLTLGPRTFCSPSAPRSAQSSIQLSVSCLLKTYLICICPGFTVAWFLPLCIFRGREPKITAVNVCVCLWGGGGFFKFYFLDSVAGI